MDVMVVAEEEEEVVEDRALTSTSARALSRAASSLGVALVEGRMMREEEEEMESTGKYEPGLESVPVEGVRGGKVCSFILPPPLGTPAAALVLSVDATGASSATPTPEAPFFFKRFKLVFQGFTTATSSSTGG